MWKCHKFGIAIRLVTGEDTEAAESIAVKCGIIKDRSKLDFLEGKSFEAQIRRIPTGPVGKSLKRGLINFTLSKHFVF